jgi:hypothetical protein
MRKIVLSVTLLLTLSAVCLSQNQAKRGPSTPEERERFVSIAHKFQTNPLDSGLAKDREWAILWLIQVPDISAKMCTDVLGGSFIKEKYSHAPEITAQMLLSSGAFAIENPDKAKDDKAQYLSAVEGVLKAYQAILQQEPQAKSKALDDLLQKQSDGKLADFVRDASKKCK